MKKILYIIAAVAALAAGFTSCQKTEDIVDPGKGGFKKGEKVTLTVSTGEQTRVSSSFDEYSLKMHFTWDENDQILVSVGGATANFTLKSGKGTSSGTFEGEMPAKGETFDVQYPVNVPDLKSQSYEVNAMPKNMMTFTAKDCTKDKGFSLAPKDAAVCFNFKGTETVGKIVVTKDPTGTPKEYTLNCTSGVDLSKADSTHFFMVLPTGTYNIKVDVFNNSDAKICSFSTTSPKNFAAGTPLSFKKTEVKPVLVTQITLSDTEVEIQMGDSKQISVTEVLPEDATDPTYTWSSDSTSVATIDENGTITPVGVGTTKIFCTPNDGSGKVATCHVTVTGKLVESITLNYPSTGTAKNVGDTAHFIVTKILPGNATLQTYEWSAVGATIDDNGVVTFGTQGTATITCTAKDGGGASTTSTVTVNDVKVSSITLNYPSTGTVKNVGDTAHFIVTKILPGNATLQTYEWSAEGATIDATSGVVTFGTQGTATITCTAKDGGGASTTSTVTVNKVNVTGVSLNYTSPVIIESKDDTLHLISTISPANATNKNVTWSSSDNNTATVTEKDGYALVEFKKVGSVTITCTSSDDNTKKATCTVSTPYFTKYTTNNFTAGTYLITDTGDSQAFKSTTTSGNTYSSAKQAVNKTGSGTDQRIYDNSSYDNCKIEIGTDGKMQFVYDKTNGKYLKLNDGSIGRGNVQTHTISYSSGWRIYRSGVSKYHLRYNNNAFSSKKDNNNYYNLSLWIYYGATAN